MRHSTIETIETTDLTFTVARLQPRPEGEPPTRTPIGQVGAAFSAHPSLVYSVDGRSIRTDAFPGAVYLTTEAPIEWLEVHGPTDAVEISIAPRVLEAAGATQARSSYGGQDALVLAAAARLRTSLVKGSGVSDVHASSIAHRLAAHIASRYAGIPTADHGNGGLTWREVEAVHDLVREHLDESLTVDVLAATVHRSPFHFARQFRATTGVPPHRFVTTVRMHRAVAMLRAGMTVADVSTAVGFTNRYQFRRQLRAYVGMEPLGIRDEIEQESSRTAAPAILTIER